MKEKLKAYESLYATAKENQEVICQSLFRNIREKLEEAQVSDEFQLPLTYAGYKHFNVPNGYDNWTRVLWFGVGCEGRHISWSDDGRQPEDEWLYCMSFGVGAYIFGESYPEETFDTFFGELKSFGPKYCDSVNRNLYFTSEAAHKVHKAFWPVFKKYQEMVKEEVDRKRVKELEAELENLKAKSVL